MEIATFYIPRFFFLIFLQKISTITAVYAVPSECPPYCGFSFEPTLLEYEANIKKEKKKKSKSSPLKHIWFLPEILQCQL